MSTNPNPYGREYSREEWLAARYVWDQYRDASQRPSFAWPSGRGPLIYASSDQIVARVGEALNEAARRVLALQDLLLAVHREAAKPPVSS